MSWFRTRINCGRASSLATNGKAMPQPSRSDSDPSYRARFSFHRKARLHSQPVRSRFRGGDFCAPRAQTQGFAKRFIDSTIGSNGALVCARSFVAFDNMLRPRTQRSKRPGDAISKHHQRLEIMRISRRFSNVISCAPILRGTITARADFENLHRSLWHRSRGATAHDRYRPADYRGKFRFSAITQLRDCRLTARGSAQGGRGANSTASRRRVLALHGRGRGAQRCRGGRFHAHLLPIENRAASSAQALPGNDDSLQVARP